MTVRVTQAAAAITALLKAPANFSAAIRLSDALSRGSLFQWFFRRMLEGLTPAEVAHLKALTLQPVDVAALREMPAGSFGHHYARFVAHNALDLDAYTAAFPPFDEAMGSQWALRRFAKVHDMHHFLLGFPVDFQGEMGLQAFNLRNFREPHALLSLPMLPLVVARYGQGPRTAREVERGWAIAGQVPNLFQAPLEEMFALDLDVVVARLGIPARPPTPWDEDRAQA